MGFKLSEEHQAVAKEILQRHITKRYRREGCKICDLAGYKGITNENLFVPCQCVNEPPARREWYEYCLQHAELKKQFIDKKE